MNIEDLYYFKHVAETQHLTKSAQDLFLSQAHLSRAIKRLEHEIGVELFDRKGRSIYLNESGKVFYHYVVKFMSVYNEAIKETQQTAARSHFDVTIVTNSGAYMPGLLAYVAEKCPAIKVRQLSAPRKKIITMLRNSSVNFSITAPPLQELDITTQVLGNEAPALIYPKNHWLDECGHVHLQDVLSEDFVGVAQGYGARDSLDAAFRAIGKAPTFVLETGDTSSVMSYVENGFGIACCAKSLVNKHPYYKDHYTDIEEVIPCILALSWNKQMDFTEKQLIFRDAAIAYFTELLGLPKNHIPFPML